MFMQDSLHFKRTLVFAAALLTSAWGFSQTKISDAAGLAAIANDLAGDYELTADITLTDEWTPIGSESTPFTGKFNGNGHAIKGMKITSSANYAGFFANLSGATVTNVRFENSYVLGNEHAGIVAGRANNNATVTKVMTSGYITGYDHVGGIVGDAGDVASTISSCMSSAYVYSTAYQAGGIAGWAKGTNTLSNNLFLGKAEIGGWGGCGGIVGFYEDGTTTVTGNVCAAVSLSGWTDTGTVKIGNRYTHAIAGTPLNDKSILTASSNLVSKDTKIYNYSSKKEIAHADLDATNNGTETDAADLQKAATYTALGWSADDWSLADGRYPVLSSMTAPFDGDYICYTMPEKLFSGMTVDTKAVSALSRTVTVTSSDPTVVAVSGTTLNFLKAGTATITFATTGDSYINGYTQTYDVNVADMDMTISKAADLQKLIDNPEGDFTLTSDIDMSGVEFTPISTFSGSIDGQGHYIRNLTYKNENTDNAAFIKTFSGKTIKNLGIEDANIVGNQNSAAFIGTMTSGTLKDCVVSSSYIEGRDHVASFVGNVNGGTVTDCLSNAEIKTRSYQAAGIAGVINAGVIQNCLFCGTVYAPGTNGAAICSLLDNGNNTSTIQNTVSAAASIQTGRDGIVINIYNSNPMTLKNNYVCDYTQVNGATIAATSDADGTKGATVADAKTNLRSKDWYVTNVKWDFDNDWKFLDNAEGKMLPVLSWMTAPLKTKVFNMPSEDGVSLAYISGSEMYDYSGMIGSWGQDITVTQVDGTDYASLVEDDHAIYVGDADGNYKGAGTANFKIAFDPAVNSCFDLGTNRSTFGVNVYQSGEVVEIGTADDFIDKVKKNSAGSFKLTADIDLAGKDFAGFYNDGNTAFSGKIDGNGHSVKNVSLKFDGSVSDKGLFGKTSNATFKNIAFVSFNIDGGSQVNHVGLIGSASNTTFDQVAVVGTVTGNDHVGLLAGDGDGVTVTNTYVKGTVNGRSQGGGFFGCTLVGGADIQNSYSNVDLTLSYRGWAGGFIGLIDKANSTVTIKNCVSMGNCTSKGDGNPHVAAPFIAGNNAGDTPNAVINFADNVYNSTAVYTGGDEGNNGWPAKNETADGGSVTAATTADPNALQQIATYSTLGWDCDNIWSINSASSYKYPVLSKVAVDEGVLTGINTVKTDANVEYAVSASNNVVTVEGLNGNARVSVYNTVGQLIAAKTGAHTVQVALPGTGLYVVVVSENGHVKSYKLVNE